MPFPYKLYETVCWLVILVTGALFFDLVYELSQPHVIVQSPVLSFITLFLFFAGYFALPFLGLSLVKSLRFDQDTSYSKLTFIRIVFFVQFIFQIFIAYNAIGTIKKIMFLFKSHFKFYPYDAKDDLLEIAAIILGLLTVYLEIFTFPLIKAIKKNYVSKMEEINTIGNHQI